MTLKNIISIKHYLQHYKPYWVQIASHSDCTAAGISGQTKDIGIIQLLNHFGSNCSNSFLDWIQYKNLNRNRIVNF